MGFFDRFKKKTKAVSVKECPLQQADVDTFCLLVMDRVMKDVT